jgi:hypothetical protein
VLHVSVEKKHGYRKERELQVKASQRVRDDTRDEAVADGYSSSCKDDDLQEEQESNIETGRYMRHIGLPRRYDYISS